MGKELSAARGFIAQRRPKGSIIKSHQQEIILSVEMFVGCLLHRLQRGEMDIAIGEIDGRAAVTREVIVAFELGLPIRIGGAR